MKVSILIQLPLIHHFNSPLTEEHTSNSKLFPIMFQLKVTCSDKMLQEGGEKHPHIFPKMAAPVSLAGKHYF